MLAVRGLGKRYDGRWVLRGLDFELAEGDCLVVRGPNGSGKSTLLKAIAGLLTPTEGSVALPEGEPHRVLGYAALDQSVYPALTVREHVEMAARLRGLDGDDVLERVGLAYAADRRGNALSTGMKARLKLALALQAAPAVLLLDEPSASLDEAGRALVESVVEEQRSRGVLVVATNDPAERRFATHELELAG